MESEGDGSEVGVVCFMKRGRAGVGITFHESLFLSMGILSVEARWGSGLRCDIIEPGQTRGVAGQAVQLLLLPRQVNPGGVTEQSAALVLVKRCWQGPFPLCC